MKQANKFTELIILTLENKQSTSTMKSEIVLKNTNQPPTQTITFDIYRRLCIAFVDYFIIQYQGRAMAETATGLSIRTPGFAPGPVHLGFVEDKVSLGQVSLPVLDCIPSHTYPIDMDNTMPRPSESILFCHNQFSINDCIS
jgi:hypothetical protein